MAGSEQESVLDLSPLSAPLLVVQEVSPRARVIARFVADLLPDCAVSVYTLVGDRDRNFWVPLRPSGDCACAGGRFKRSVVTGLTQVNADSPEIAPLNEILQWAARSEEVIHLRQHGEQIDSDREETRAKFRRYFERLRTWKTQSGDSSNQLAQPPA